MIIPAISAVTRQVAVYRQQKEDPKTGFRDRRNRRMRFQRRDYDNGRYLDEPNFQSNFIYQPTYSAAKSSLVKPKATHLYLKNIESQSQLPLVCVRLPNIARQAKCEVG